MRARHRHFSYKAAGASIALDTRYIHGVSDGTTVQTWSDRSGNARDAAQATAGERATYKTAIQGGNGILRFDGNDVYNATFVTGTAYSLYSIFKRSGSNTNIFNNATFVAAAGVAGNTSASGRRYQLWYDDASSGQFSIFSNATTDTRRSRNNDWNVHSVSAPIGTGTKVYYLNGGGEVSASVSALGGVTSGSVRMTVGASSWDNVFRFNGDMGLLVAYESAHSASLRRRLEHAAAYSFKISCN
jgi:hypothetical protein